MTKTGTPLPAGFVSKLFRLEGRVAVVTGGASGLGESIVRGFVQAGAHVIIADRDLARAESVVHSCGGQTSALQLDVSEAQSVEALAQNVARDHGQIDVLVNSAGISVRHPAQDFPLEDWERVLRVNLRGTFLCCQQVGRVMLQQGRGSIVNIASIGGLAGYPFTTAYAQSKGGVVQMTRSLAVEWINRGVRVNALAPSMFETPLLKNAAVVKHSNAEWVMGRTPIGRLGQSHEIVGPALFLASDASSMVTGHILAVDGGYLAS